MLDTASRQICRQVARSSPTEVADVIRFTQALKNNAKIIGLCHGCFDLLHFGHLRHFEAAASLCDTLIVSVTSDRYVNKGPNRPVYPAELRAELIAGLSCVDYVIVSDHPSALEVLDELRPNRFFKGQDYQSSPGGFNPNFLKERDFALSIGAEVMHTQEEMSSSTEFLKQLLES